jgi:hypothetical protein
MADGIAAVLVMLLVVCGYFATGAAGRSVTSALGDRAMRADRSARIWPSMT